MVENGMLVVVVLVLVVLVAVVLVERVIMDLQEPQTLAVEAVEVV